ncbi:hypothetical protein [Burkholderia contaminans]|uniref:hypothetical protein n=1 Tax=Burkholderia contaminans TaxID=488447 RepID=UPI000F5A98D0|nr:hypothetical protein [Burkholderia contaminans]
MMFPPRTMLVETAPGSARESLSAYGKQWGVRTIIPFDIHTFLSFLPGAGAGRAAAGKLFTPFAALLMITSRLPYGLALPLCVFPARQQAGVSLRCEPAA